jgi:LysM repeat protein
VEALPRIITGLRDMGYRLVTVNEMLPKTDVVLHTVQKDDTLYALSRRYGVTVNQIILANGL